METPKTKKLILPVHCPTNDYIDFDHGIIELTQEDIDKIRKLAEVVKTAKESIGSGVARIKAHHNGITVMQADYDAEEEDGKPPLKEPEYGRLEGEMLNVSDFSFFWSFYPKFCEDACTTGHVYLKDLDNFETYDERS